MKVEKVRTLARLKARELTKKEIKKIAGGIKREKGLIVRASTRTFTHYIVTSDEDIRQDCVIL